MCKFHKDVARDIATDSTTSVFDAGRYAVALVAMAKFRIEQYMPAMYASDGFVPSLMRTPEAVKALDDSGIRKPLSEVQAFRDAHIDAMRRAMDDTAARYDLSLPALNIGDTITEKGYQHCAKMAPDPTKNGPFLDEAVVELFEGYDDAEKAWARHNLDVVAVAHKPEFEPIRAATAHFLSQPGVVDTLKTMFENSLVKIFEEARDENAVDLETDGCVMCGHGSRADDFNRAARDETLPAADTQTPAPSKGLLGQFNLRACTSCVGTGATGGILAHLPCAAVAVIGGASGAALSMRMMEVMVMASPFVSAGITAAIDLVRTGKVSATKMAMSGVIGLGVALGINHYAMDKMHDMPGGPSMGHDQHHMHSASDPQRTLVELIGDDTAICRAPIAPAMAVR